MKYLEEQTSFAPCIPHGLRLSPPCTSMYLFSDAILFIYFFAPRIAVCFGFGLGIGRIRLSGSVEHKTIAEDNLPPCALYCACGPVQKLVALWSCAGQCDLNSVDRKSRILHLMTALLKHMSEHVVAPRGAEIEPRCFW